MKKAFQVLGPAASRGWGRDRASTRTLTARGSGVAMRSDPLPSRKHLLSLYGTSLFTFSRSCSRICEVRVGSAARDLHMAHVWLEESREGSAALVPHTEGQRAPAPSPRRHHLGHVTHGADA